MDRKEKLVIIARTLAYYNTRKRCRMADFTVKIATRNLFSLMHVYKKKRFNYERA